MGILRSTFISLSEARQLRSLAESSSIGKKLSRRFVPGLEIEDVVASAQDLNRRGISSTLDSLGENVSDEAHAQRSASTYHTMLDKIGELKLNANVSLKLTQMGMDLQGGIAERIVAGLVDHAHDVDSFVRVDMEGSPYTQATIDMVRRLNQNAKSSGRVGVVIQSYLRRSESDIELLLSEGIRIRLCKGAYQESPEIAFPSKADVDKNYVLLSQKLLRSGIFHGLATHDETIIEQMKKMVKTEGILPGSFEFQMLYGIRRDLQESLVKEGYGMRVYIPFGHEWYPYFMRRLAERPANAIFIAKNLIR
jgi:proline dehydrogenase